MGVLTGAILLVAAALKLGVLADFISLPVLAGFKAGTGLLIISGQLGKVLGTEQSGDNFFQKTWSAITHVPDADGRTVLLAGLTLALLVAIKRWAPPAFPALSSPFAFGIVVSSALDPSPAVPHVRLGDPNELAPFPRPLSVLGDDDQAGGFHPAWMMSAQISGA